MNILDLASQDFTLVRESNNIYTTREHDSLKFFVDTNSWFWYKERVGGGIKRFVEFFWNLSEVPEEFNGTFTDLPKLQYLYDEPYVRVGRKFYSKYVEDRGISEETANEFDLEFDNISESVILPITNFSNRRVGIIKRKVKAKDKKDRYKFILWDNFRPALWQMHRLEKVDGDSKVFIFEGAWSAMLWWQVLKQKNCHTFAILGAYPSKSLKELLNGLNLYYVPDCDEAGESGEKEFCKIVGKCKVLRLDKMPDEVSENEIKYIYVNHVV